MVLNTKDCEAERPWRKPADEMLEVGRRAAARPRLTDQTPEEILGYDEAGLPT